MTFDSHVHAWNAWPYDDPAKPASADALLAAMAANGIVRALVVCADIDPTADNNAYVAAEARRHPDALLYAVEADCVWSPYYHRPGAVDRLHCLVELFPDAVGVTHYVDRSVDDWFFSAEGRRWLGLVASEFGVLTLAAGPDWTESICEIAREHELTILWHHLAGLTAVTRERFATVVAAVDVPNVLVKLSGLHYASASASGAPWHDVFPVVDDVYGAFGAGRICWGSDFPASLRYTDYASSLAAASEWLERLEPDEREAIMGGNLARVLGR